MDQFHRKAINEFDYYYRGEMTDKIINKKHKKDITKKRRTLERKDTKRQLDNYLSY